MSEPVGQISIEQWLQFEKALQFHAQAKNWDKLVLVNQKMADALKRAGKPNSRSQLLARQSLARTHQQVLQQLNQDKDQLKREMSQFKQQQDGLAAYQMTCASAGVHND
ncbi:conserved hypothetical protein [Shewanella halifaxensis HAW-EB4]|uniref:Flagellar protein FliT n=1 Tax=Shewanella halifaxensis (strain HAW-EB4) TaxID=458817 RepID=B0TPK2_SHEHH|nr:hypothetical protein [Shewanella halifaxensis]ABZ78803.1 conserved hypothetical protein [Shewanella halifaxensis HAW-EB4]